MRALHVTHNAIGTALVRSQVLPYARGLMQRGWEIDLVTFERGEPYPDGEFPRERWHPLRPIRGRSLAAKVVDTARGAWATARIARARRPEILHARSYLPAAICWLIARLFGIPYIFDMRGFMGEEYVDAGIWDEHDVRYRAVRAAEGRLLRDAAAIVILTHAGARRLRQEPRYARATHGREVSVIPCAVDLERFRPGVRSGPPTLVYSGSLGMWYLLDQMVAVYDRARSLEPELRFLFLNRNEHDLIRATWSRAGLPERLREIRAVDHGDMPAALVQAQVGIALLKRAPSKVGSSPVKIAEYLACGLPVLVSEGLGDSDEQVRSAEAGHVIRSYDEPALREAGFALVALLRDGRARERARALAERVFDVRAGISEYERIYRQVSARTRARP